MAHDEPPTVVPTVTSSPCLLDATFALHPGLARLLAAQDQARTWKALYVPSFVREQLAQWASAHRLPRVRSASQAALEALDQHRSLFKLLPGPALPAGWTGATFKERRELRQRLLELLADRFLGRAPLLLLTASTALLLAVEERQKNVPLSQRQALHYGSLRTGRTTLDLQASWYAPLSRPSFFARLVRWRSAWHDPLPPFSLRGPELPVPPDAPLHHPAPPRLGPGARLHLLDNRAITLGGPPAVGGLHSGGEGSIYTVHEEKGWACKLFEPEALTANRFRKLELMLQRTVPDPALCWPIALAYWGEGSAARPVGYVMPRAAPHARPLSTSLFLDPGKFQAEHPRWNRRHSLALALQALEAIVRLHQLNVVIGDLSPSNVLFCPGAILQGRLKAVQFVDCDSLQIENLPCPVGTPDATPAHLQGKTFSRTLRTQADDGFAIAVLLFKLLVPGQAPYDHKGGGQPEDNIRKGLFPYEMDDNKDGHASLVPSARAKYAWSHLSRPLKRLFVLAFKGRKWPALPVWIDVLEDYRTLLSDPSRVFVSPIKRRFDLNICPRDWRAMEESDE